MATTIDSSGWIDVTVGLRDKMPSWPGDPLVKISKVLDMDKGDRLNLTQIQISAHSATHMDAPRHFIRDGQSVDQAPLDVLIGRARVIEIADTESIKVEELRKHGVRKGERLLFKTRGGDQLWQRDSFATDYVYISDSAARMLAATEVRLVGIDYLSVEGFDCEDSPTHLALLGAGIWLIEGLDLSRVTQGEYEMICLPLKIVGADGAPARVLLRPVP
ncbi:MAG: cyclase family protein [Candidatus Alcyoniella australis]|nr:cyclase family protein [Candidatus Alcyoniella australis]